LDPRIPPTTPALVLVPAEMDFDAELQRSAPAYGPQRTSYSDGEGFYMTASYIDDLEEGWPFGDPELAVHTAVKNENNDVMEFKACAGDNFSSGSAYYFDQNDHYWTGTVKLAAEGLLGDKNVEFVVWEDDYNRCDGTNNLKPHSSAGIISGLVDVVNALLKVIRLDTLSGTWDTIEAGYGLAKETYEYATAVTSDDLIGIVKRLNYGCYMKATGPIAYGLLNENGQTTNSWIAVDNTDEAERVLCQGSPPSPIEVEIVGPSQIPPTGAEECAWSASITNGGGGTLTYLWEWNSQPVGFEDYYVPNGPSEGSHWLKLTVANEVYSDWDGITVDVDDEYSCF
jgi:hypothetical protein